MAGNVRVPIHERAIGILLPRPHVKRIERWQAEGIRALEIMKKLPPDALESLAFPGLEAPRQELLVYGARCQPLGAFPTAPV